MPSNQLPIPTAFPAPGRFEVAQRVTLLCADPDAQIHYTLDRSQPTLVSPQFNPYELIFLDAPYQGVHASSIEVTIRAAAFKEDLAVSETVDFAYTIARRDLDAYEAEPVAPGVWMIRDWDDDKMYLVKGQTKALLIDTGGGGNGLRACVEPLAGGLPLEVAITHAHPDHVAQIAEFQVDCPIWMNRLDLPRVERFNQNMHFGIDTDRIQELLEGHVFDLGERVLRVYEVPGHTMGHTVLLDENNGLLFSGDAVGNNRRTIVDALWMQKEGQLPIDEYLEVLKAFRAKTKGKFTSIYNGHNDQPLDADSYLDHLQRAAQTLVDQGVSVLMPSLRPTGVWMVSSGDRLTDPNWAAINVNRETFLSSMR